MDNPMPLPQLLGTIQNGRFWPIEVSNQGITRPGLTVFAQTHLVEGAICLVQWGSYRTPEGEEKVGWIGYALDADYGDTEGASPHQGQLTGPDTH